MLDIWINIFKLMGIAFAISFLIAALINFMLKVAQSSTKRGIENIRPGINRVRRIQAIRKQRIKDIMNEHSPYPIINYYYARPTSTTKSKRPEVHTNKKQHHGRNTSI